MAMLARVLEHLRPQPPPNPPPAGPHVAIHTAHPAAATELPRNANFARPDPTGEIEVLITTPWHRGRLQVPPIPMTPPLVPRALANSKPVQQPMGQSDSFLGAAECADGP